jgi:hypothetical protein
MTATTSMARPDRLFEWRLFRLFGRTHTRPRPAKCLSLLILMGPSTAHVLLLLQPPTATFAQAAPSTSAKAIFLHEGGLLWVYIS